MRRTTGDNPAEGSPANRLWGGIADLATVTRMQSGAFGAALLVDRARLVLRPTARIARCRQIRTPGLRFTKPLLMVSRGSSASIFERLKAIDSEIETLQEERRALLGELQKGGE